MVCRTTIIVFSILYLLALIAFFSGTFGWLAQERDPLSGVFLLPLGLPWMPVEDLVLESAKPWFAALAPVLIVQAMYISRLSQGVLKDYRFIELMTSADMIEALKRVPKFSTPVE